MFNPDLAFAKQQLLRTARSHILARKASAPRVLDAALAFMKRKYPEIWLSEEGLSFLAALRDAEANADFENPENVDAALLALATEHGAVNGDGPVSSSPY